MLRYKLRTLLIVLALGPPALAGLWLAPSYIQADELGLCIFALGHGVLGYVAGVAQAARSSRRRAS